MSLAETLPSRSYYTLMASLPALPTHFDVGRAPISGVRLDHRLRMLEADDHAQIEAIRDFLFFDRQMLEVTEDEVIKRYHKLLEFLTNPVARDFVEYRMDIRTIVAGLRRRRLHREPPKGVGKYVDTIRRNWHEPDFNIGGSHPWVGKLERAFAAGDVEQADRIILSAAWKKWRRRAEDFYFSFEAVILYVACWDILDRWASRDAERGRQRFDALLSETIGEY